MASWQQERGWHGLLGTVCWCKIRVAIGFFLAMVISVAVPVTVPAYEKNAIFVIRN